MYITDMSDRKRQQQRAASGDRTQITLSHVSLSGSNLQDTLQEGNANILDFKSITGCGIAAPPLYSGTANTASSASRLHATQFLV